MKGMQSISRGSSFAGVMAYAFDGDEKKPRELKGEILGGNMSGRNPEELAREFNASKAIRPDVGRPVWHNSLRLPKDEKVDKDKWVEIADAYMLKMGFSEHNQRVYVLHDDADGQHIHIVASRIGLDGSLFYGKNENFISTKKIAELEVEFGLEITTTATYDEKGKVVMPDRSRPKKGELGKAEGTDGVIARFTLADLIDKAMVDKPTASVFVERLVLSGVEVRANFSKDTLNGFSFSIDGVPFKGSQLGKLYTGKALFQRGLSYDKDRDYAAIKQLGGGAARNADGDQAARDAGKTEPNSGNHGGDNRDQKAPGDERGNDRAGSGELDGSAVRDSEAGPGRSEPTGNIDGAERKTPEGIDPGVDRSDGSAEIDPRAETSTTSTERPGSASAAMAPAGVDHAQSGSVSDGLSSGVEISVAGPILTGDKGSDELLRASHSDRLKAARESLARQKSQHAQDMAAAKKRQAELDKPSSNRLSWLAERSMDSSWRAMEIQAFARAIGAAKFEVTCSSPNPKEKPIKRIFTAAQLQNPSIIKSMAHMSARRFDVSIRPDPASGVILLKGLDADGVKKLEAIGLQAAAVVDVAGKKEAWIRTDAKLSTEERTALTKRLETLTGVEQKHGGAGGLAGFSSGQRAVSLSACPGQVAPAIGEMICEVKAVIFEAKAERRLALAIEKEVRVKSTDFVDHGGIQSLRYGVLSKQCRDAVAEATSFGGSYDAARVERGVLEALARQGVEPGQAYRAVFDESRVAAGDERHAADAVAQAYTRVALVKEGKDLAGVDLAAESAKRHPDLMKRAESRQDSELKAIHEKGRAEALAESARMAQKAELQRIAKAQEVAERRARELDEEGLVKPK